MTPSVYTAFFVAQVLEEFDPLAPQREAALFYGLFLRGTRLKLCAAISTFPRSFWRN